MLNWITPRISGQTNEEHEANIEALHQSIIVTREAERAAEGSFSYAELLHGGRTQNWRRIALCAGVMAIQQLSGCVLEFPMFFRFG